MMRDLSRIIFFVLLMGVTYVADRYLIRPADHYLAAQKARVQSKLDKLEEFEKATVTVEGFTKQLDELQDAIDFFESKLPPKSEIHKVLEQVTVIAQKNGLHPKTIRTLEQKTSSGDEINRTGQPRYIEQPLKMELVGNFNSFYAFLLEIEDGAGREQSGGDSTNNKQQSEEYLTVAIQGKKVRNTTRLLAVLFGTVLLCLWFMIRQSTPSTATASGSAATDTQQKQIEKAIVRLAGTSSVMFRRIDRIVKKFYEFSKVPQVGVNELVKNPFKHEIFIGGRGDLFDAEYYDPNNDGPIELLSIMKTEGGNCCMIDDKILYEGDSIRDLKVVQIGENFVKLEGKPSGGQETEIILKLSQ